MTKDVIELAREAGLSYKDVDYSGLEFCALNGHEDLTPALIKFAALVAARERERIEVLRAALKPFADFEAVRSTMGASSPKSGLLWAVHSWAGIAEISAEDMQAAIRALNTEGEENGRP